MKVIDIGTVDLQGLDESKEVYFLVSDCESKNQVETEISAFCSGEESLLEEFRSSCWCLHDCCGHWFNSGMKMLHYDSTFKTATVKVSYYRNV